MALHEEQSWPKPTGGREGTARTRFGRDAEGRAPVSWQASDLGPGGARLTAALARCAASAGRSGLTLTMYVDAEGRPIAAGVALADESGLSAVDCALRAAKAERYPSPGSFPAKVVVSAP